MNPLWILAATAALATGCTSAQTPGIVVPIPAGGGTTYHLIIGLGVVKVNDTKQSAAVVTDSHSLGLVVSDRPGLKLGVGYASSSVVSVPPNATDVRIDVSRQPWGPLRVEAHSTELEESGHDQRDEQK
jgi:hypothetical protein